MKIEYLPLALALRDHSPGAVATAIERYGCYGDDRYGRFLKLDNSGKAAALDAIAEFYSHVKTWDDGPDSSDGEGGRVPSPAEMVIDSPEGGDHVSLWHFGWPSGEVPSFDDSQPIGKAIESRPLEMKERNSLLTIIAALLECIGGNLPGVDKHPSFESEAKLIEAISAHFQGYTGLSISNLSRKFPEAKRIIAAK